ncbi:hypothetical protein C0J52_15123, partial [Blattella germanica]
FNPFQDHAIFALKTFKLRYCKFKNALSLFQFLKKNNCFHCGSINGLGISFEISGNFICKIIENILMIPYGIAGLERVKRVSAYDVVTSWVQLFKMPLCYYPTIL